MKGKIAIVIHWFLLRRGLSFSGIGDSFSNDDGKLTEILPANWNQTDFTWKYREVKNKSNKFILYLIQDGDILNCTLYRDLNSKDFSVDLSVELAVRNFHLDEFLKRLKRAFDIDFFRQNLDSLPNEIIVRIFGFLNTRDIISTDQLSKKMKEVCRIAKIWLKVNFYEALPVPPALHLMGKISGFFLKDVLEKGCKYLNIVNYEICGVFELEKKIDLVYLKVESASFGTPLLSIQSLEKLLSLCDFLVKISFNYLAVSIPMIDRISFQKRLQVLEINGCLLSPEAIENIVANISSSIKVLSLNYSISVNDNHIETLVNRCQEIETLNLAYTGITRKSITLIIEHFEKSLKRLDITHTRYRTGFVGMSLIDLQIASNLELLIGTFGLNMSSDLAHLQNILPNLRIYDLTLWNLSRYIEDHQNFYNQLQELDSVGNLPNKSGLWEIQIKPF